ncbi:monovalent cation/H(+) antiporter subunit G [Cytobacillus spongiae]|jgi:multicomponent Na+:H+ antiporter subunit G|uniref:monovalent cation/H(+) antiporter subunit G n=1 Tax=Cytobacillus spongiae TaxID=2901381 RepID=UPI001F3A780C|nr:monovalent cation/H(+) antiporter subunit G [Cytobacillus spongiae]UII57986.1 monovalent cation/H(+) antiporter subunit G [Cytobacillus spongiae]
MNAIVSFVTGSFLIIGAFLSLVTAFGLLRLPDVYTRNHAASKAATLGVMSILLGTFLYFFLEEGHFNSRIILGIAFIFMTSPVAGHLISRAAYNSGIPLWEKSVQDDLKKAKEERKAEQ